MSSTRKLNVKNETDRLTSVILGVGKDQGEQLDINPVSKYHIENGTYPTEEANVRELSAVEKALVNEGVEVIRPKNLPNTEQIFTRDIGFVIDDRFIVANMKEEVRQPEIDGIEGVLHNLPQGKVVKLSNEAIIEGGDVILMNDHVFVGLGKRTNQQGFEELKALFPKKHFHSIALNVTDDPKTNILHLDCTFQPVGQDMAIIYEDGFKEYPEVIYDLFGDEKLIKIDQSEMNQMFPNVFSIAPDKVLVEEHFGRLISVLRSKGITPVPVPYAETAKLSGLLRCSTLPLFRSGN